MEPEKADELNRIPLYQQLEKILKQNPENAYSTRRHRLDALSAVVKNLWEHYKLRNLHNLQTKHVQYLVSLWKTTDKGKGNLQNNLSHLRWLLDKLGKSALLPARNVELGIEAKERNVRQGRFIGELRQAEILSKLQDPKLQVVVQLSAQFGMRFEEASLFRPHYDVSIDASGQKVWIKRGTKGGRERFVPIVTQGQRDVLAKAQALVADKQGCLIDKDLKYVQWKNHAYKEFRRAGLSRAGGSTFHDLRRTYAIMEMLRLVLCSANPCRVTGPCAGDE